MSDFIVALGLVLAIEGTLYSAFPGLARRMMEQGLSVPERSLRMGGLAALAGGVALVWLVRG